MIITALNDTVCFSVYIGPEKRPNIPYKVVDEGNGRFRIEFTTVMFYFSKKEKKKHEIIILHSVPVAVGHKRAKNQSF